MAYSKTASAQAKPPDDPTSFSSGSPDSDPSKSAGATGEGVAHHPAVVRVVNKGQVVYCWGAGVRKGSW